MDLWDWLGHSWWMYAQLAFSLGMVVHAYRSNAESFWYWVIFLFQPIGAWVYFFAVFVRTFQFRRGSSGPAWQRRLSLDELRYRAERTPTVSNRLALAEGLMEKGKHAEALPLLIAILQIDNQYCQAMHDLAVCQLACEQPQEAVATLKRLLQRDHRWSYYKAWRTLIDAHLACGQTTEALHACRELVKMVPTLENKCLLAEHLLEHKLTAEAIPLLDQALEDYSFAPMGKRLKNWGWAREAQKLLREAESQT
jgi:hypothetical protein